MTNSEILSALRLVLDEVSQDYISSAEYNNAINQAQMLAIHRAFRTGDFRCLRPLVKETDLLLSGATIPNDDFLYPLAAYITKNTVPINFTNSSKMRVTYAEPNVYWGYDGNGLLILPPDIATNQAASVYFYTTLKNNETDATTVHFNTQNDNATSNVFIRLLYVKNPIVVNIYGGTNSTNKISLPLEYHPAIVSFAAELLQGIDVNEVERGDLVFQNTRQNIERFGNL